LALEAIPKHQNGASKENILEEGLDDNEIQVLVERDSVFGGNEERTHESGTKATWGAPPPHPGQYVKKQFSDYDHEYWL
jgi:hypothetical protein